MEHLPSMINVNVPVINPYHCVFLKNILIISYQDAKCLDTTSAHMDDFEKPKCATWSELFR